MLIYGNTPRDIGRMLMSKRWQLIAMVLAFLSVALIYEKFNQPKVELKALDKFWQTLGSGMNSTGVE